jgi:translation initiation factor 4E
MHENNLELNEEYNIWFHQFKDDWSINGYKHIYSIKNAIDFWKLYNNWDLLGGIIGKHFFIMKNDIKPIWEDDNNKDGGCWSFKVYENQVGELWEDISVLFVNKKLLNNNDCVGLSVSQKKNNFCVVKIWNTNYKNNSIKNINKKILEKWGTDVIYIAHNINH